MKVTINTLEEQAYIKLRRAGIVPSETITVESRTEDSVVKLYTVEIPEVTALVTTENMVTIIAQEKAVTIGYFDYESIEL